MKTEGQAKFTTVARAAELMDVSSATVYRYVHSGVLPAVRSGHGFRIPMWAVEKWKDEQSSRSDEGRTTTG